MWDEGSGTGVYLWFLMMTLPVGFVIFVIGLVMLIVRKSR